MKAQAFIKCCSIDWLRGAGRVGGAGTTSSIILAQSKVHTTRQKGKLKQSTIFSFHYFGNCQTCVLTSGNKSVPSIIGTVTGKIY